MSSSSDPSSIAVGAVISGRYRVDGVIGSGSMGEVFSAKHIELRKRVAIKVLRGEVLGNDEAIGRFRREARVAAQLDSEHIAEVTDVGTVQDGVPYLVMEFLDGSDLQQRLDSDGPLPMQQAVDYVLQACEGLAQAHAAGIVHRDLKPANLFVCTRPDGSELVKIVDFGISKKTKGDISLTLTSTQAMMGSPLYMSPEQMTNAKGVDARADIWSMGVTLYQLVSGHVPFNAGSLAALVIKIDKGEFKHLSVAAPQLPRAFCDVVMACLVRDPSGRISSVEELAIALEPFASDDGRPSVPRILGVFERSQNSKAQTKTLGLMPLSSTMQAPAHKPNEQTSEQTGTGTGTLEVSASDHGQDEQAPSPPSTIPPGRSADLGPTMLSEGTESENAGRQPTPHEALAETDVAKPPPSLEAPDPSERQPGRSPRVLMVGLLAITGVVLIVMSVAIRWLHPQAAVQPGDSAPSAMSSALAPASTSPALPSSSSQPALSSSHGAALAASPSLSHAAADTGTHRPSGDNSKATHAQPMGTRRPNKGATSIPHTSMSAAKPTTTSKSDQKKQELSPWDSRR